MSTPPSSHFSETGNKITWRIGPCEPRALDSAAMKHYLWPLLTAFFLVLGGCPSTVTQTTDGSGGPIDCGTRTDVSSPVLLAPEQLNSRHGSGWKRFSQVSSSVEQPIEVCGADGQASYLKDLSCDDGSSPFKNIAAAKLARFGAAGLGGRCGSVIDHYRVKCSEGEYDVYMDMYMCPSH